MGNNNCVFSKTFKILLIVFGETPNIWANLTFEVPPGFCIAIYVTIRDIVSLVEVLNVFKEEISFSIILFILFIVFSWIWKSCIFKENGNECCVKNFLNSISGSLSKLIILSWIFLSLVIAKSTFPFSIKSCNAKDISFGKCMFCFKKRYSGNVHGNIGSFSILLIASAWICNSIADEPVKIIKILLLLSYTILPVNVQFLSKWTSSINKNIGLFNSTIVVWCMFSIKLVITSNILTS